MWIVCGFFSIYIFAGLMYLAIVFADKREVTIAVKRVKIFICTIFVTLMLNLTNMIFAVMSVGLSDKVWGNSLFFSMLLVLTWYVTEKMYQAISGEGLDYTGEKILDKSEKNICNLISIIGVIVGTIGINIQSKDSKYLLITCVAASIICGAYIPVSGIFKGKNIKEFLYMDIVNEFISVEKKEDKFVLNGTKKTIGVFMISAVAVLISTIVLLSNDLAVKVNKIIVELGIGIALALVSLIGLLVLIVVIQEKKKRKQEDKFE